MHEPNESGLPIDQGEARKPVVWIMGQDALDADAARRALSAHHEVELLADDEAALSRLPHEVGPDALILDGALTGRPYIELCRRIRATRDELDLPILMLTAPLLPAAILEGLSAGANDCLAKPYDAAELLGRVSALVRRKQLYEAQAREQAAALSQDVRQGKERDRLLAAEQAARKEAEALNQLMDQFLATVSHELRTPLTAILGWVRILRSGKLPGERHDHALETVERNARAQAQLIEDLLDVSRIMTGKLGLDVQPIEPLTVIEAALSSVQPSASAKGIRLLRALDPRAGPVVGDPGRLQQIIWHLLSNAIKFTPRGGRVQIRLERVESSVEIEVTDTGQGIEPAFLPHVFERFRQADGSTTRAHGGLGLGLAIVKDLVELHGGTIEALSSGKGLGATLIVRLPTTDRALPIGRALPRTGALDRGGPPSILATMPARPPSGPHLRGGPPRAMPFADQESPMPRVLVSDPLSEQGLSILRQGQDLTVDYRPGLSEAELAAAIPGAQGLVIRSGSKVTAGVLAAATDLRVIGRAGIGVDNIDVPAATKRGVVVMNTPTGNAVTTAEHAIALLFSLARMIPQASASLKAGKWEKKRFEGRELAGKTLGVVGLGNIGRIVADRARALGMLVVGFDPVLSPDRAAALGVELVSLEELFQRADAITVHTPLTAETKGLVNDAVVGKLKKGVLLINAARGGIYDLDALLRGLQSGHIGGVALDVFEVEPPPADLPILKHDRCIVTPHLGASTTEAQDRVALEIAEQVVAYLATGATKNAVNMPSVTREVAAKIWPYTELGDRLGSFLAQIERGLSPRSIEVECVGDPAELSLKLVAASAVAGFLRRYLDAPVNQVSAAHVAADRGIALRELRTAEPHGKYASRVILRVQDEGGAARTVEGTLGADGSARLVKWGDYEVEAHLGGPALVVVSVDKPGVIGFLGTALGNAHVNVARVHLGLAPSGDAISVWNLSQPIPVEVLEEVQRSPNVRSATTIEV